MRITFNEIKSNLGINTSYDLMNAIREDATEAYKNYVPLASKDNIVDIGQGILNYQSVQNEFITALVDRIGLVIIRNVSLRNQLAKFKKGRMPQGRTIQEIFVDLTKAKKYDPEDAEETVFRREIPNVKTLYHERNRQDFYEQTIQDSSLQSAFISWNNFESFTAGIFNAMYNSAEVDEYNYMKLLIENYYSKNLFKVVAVPEVSGQASAMELVKKIRATATKMTLPNGSREFNSLAVHTRTDMENLHLLITADLLAEIDVDVLARAFNMDKTSFMGSVTVVDEFASPNIQAIMIDESFYMVYDNEYKMESIRNPKGLYWNYYLHIWQTLSTSRFANAVAFVSGAVAPVTNVIVDPVITTIKQGKEFQFNAFVRQTDKEKHEVVWSVEGRNGNALTTGTAIDDKGVLKVGEAQTGELLVKATVSYQDGEETKEIVGESVVTTVQLIK